MDLESFPNELFMEIFGYLTIVDILRAFRGLNSRIEKLFDDIYHLDLRTISKRHLNIFLKQYLSSIIGRVQSGYLPNYDKISPRAEFLFIFHQFISLESLSLCQINSLDILKRIILQCHHLERLTHLKIMNCSKDHSSDLINSIWSLPKLTHYHQDNSICNYYWSEISITSSSIKHVSLGMDYLKLCDLNNLFKYTPKLQSFRTDKVSYSDETKLDIIAHSLTFLKIVFTHSSKPMKILFQKLPNLEKLSIETYHIYLNGYEWKTILTNYFPKMKQFQLKMPFQFSHSNNKEQQVDELIDSFSTSFWSEKQKRFFRCIWNQSSLDQYAILYTIPGIIDELNDSEKYRFKSTCPDKISPKLYDHVQIFRYWYEQTNSSEDLPPSYPKFHRIHHLEIKLPFNNTFWTFVPTVNQLTRLDVIMTVNSTYSQLQPLLDQAPYLGLLTISYMYDVPITSSSFTITSPSIRQLKFLKANGFYTPFMSKAECLALSNSPIGRQCEVLMIYLEKHTSVLDLISNIPELRSLKFMCKEGKFDKSELLKTETEFHACSTIEYSEKSSFMHLEIDRET